MFVRGKLLSSIYQEQDEKKLIYPLKFDYNHWIRLYSLYLRHQAQLAIVKIIQEILAENPSLKCSRDRMTIYALATAYALAVVKREGELALDAFLFTDLVLELHSEIRTYLCRGQADHDFFHYLTFYFEWRSFYDFKDEYRDNGVDRFDRDYKNQLLKKSVASLEAVIQREYNSHLIVKFHEKPKCDLSNTPPIPLSMHCKEQRILNVNGFNRSKVKFVNHDVLDHIFCYHHLYSRGAFNSHRQLFEKLGWPFSETNMNREGELIASIGYGCRQYFWLKQFSPLEICRLDLDVFSAFISERFFSDSGQADDNGRVLSQIRSILSDIIASGESDLFSHVLCNCILEAEELQRTVGMSIRFDQKGRLEGRFDPWDPVYILFVLESISIVSNSLRETIFPQSVSLWSEKILWESFLGPAEGVSYNVRIKDFNELYKVISGSKIPPPVYEYIETNCFFSASP